MPWARFDDAFPEHPKIDPLSHGAFRLHVTGICWCARNLTDGYVPAVRATRLIHGYRPAMMSELEAANLWVPADGGWRIHDYLDFNPTAESVERKRKADRVRKDSVRNPNGQDDGFRGDSSRPVPVPVPVPDPHDVSHSPSLTLVGDQPGSGDGYAKLVNRLVGACVGRNRQRVESEAAIVVDHLSRHVDRRIIDQAIGYAEANGDVKLPRWVFSSVRAQCEVDIPVHPLEEVGA